ncbi:hypothetical protein E4U43_001259 [Claviceps pusilla]|uniref:Uncharacterized protein n=1 Tax=Claviceps pusilla TaxID=123648 RepID=A0A9P7SW32_9HYPO|nr:hypothetical protein E4U43_001259 [Claviceps pusilla]
MSTSMTGERDPFARGRLLDKIPSEAEDPVGRWEQGDDESRGRWKPHDVYAVDAALQQASADCNFEMLKSRQKWRSLVGPVGLSLSVDWRILRFAGGPKGATNDEAVDPTQKQRRFAALSGIWNLESGDDAN